MSHMAATNIANATSAASNIVSATTATTNIAPKWSRQKNVTRDLEPANSEASYFSAPEIISLTVTVVQIHVQFSKFLSLCLSQGWTLRWKRLHWESLPWWSPIRWIYIYIGSLYSWLFSRWSLWSYCWCFWWRRWWSLAWGRGLVPL